MNDQQIPPEQFAGALGKLMDSASDIYEVCCSISRAAEYHHLRRAKQIDLDEKPLDHVPLAIPIATLRGLEQQIAVTRAMFEIVEAKNRQLDSSNLYLVPKSKIENGAK